MSGAEARGSPVSQVVAWVGGAGLIRELMMSQEETPLTPPSLRMTLRALAPSIMVNGVCTYLVYSLLKNQTTVSDYGALLAASVPALVFEVASLRRQRQLDVLGVLVLGTLVISAVVSLVGGSPKVLLVRESFVTAGFGVACILSLCLARPLMFYVIRYFATANSPAKLSTYNGRWQYPAFRRYFRIVTLVWGIAYIAELPVRLFLVFHLSIVRYLAIAPIIFYVLLATLIAFSISYSRRLMARSAGQANQLG